MTRARALAVLLLLAAPAARAQSVALSPAVVQLRGEAGQGTTQTLTLHNGTGLDLAFELEAKDVVVRDGQRRFLPAGELAGSIAATAVFSRRALTVPAGRDGAVEVTVTLPHLARHRAVVVVFRGVTRIAQRGYAATVSLGTLLTFTLSDHLSLAVSELAVTPPSDARNATFELALVNDGSEPVVPSAVAVVLDAAGHLVARVPVETARLLPGERATLRAEYPGELRAGTYRVLSTIELAGRPLTRSAQLTVRPSRSR